MSVDEAPEIKLATVVKSAGKRKGGITLPEIQALAGGKGNGRHSQRARDVLNEWLW
jgi:hypothetical protein